MYPLVTVYRYVVGSWLSYGGKKVLIPENGKDEFSCTSSRTKENEQPPFPISAS